jgi:quercetin dioxygenase-like cupin family protein
MMKPIEPHQRKVVNIRDESAYTHSQPEGEYEHGTSYIQLNPDAEKFVGFYIYRMGPGSSSVPHMHGGAEEFLVVEGELTDNDGTTYRAGDVVYLAGGTEHNSYSEKGCIVAVYSQDKEHAPGTNV